MPGRPDTDPAQRLAEAAARLRAAAPDGPADGVNAAAPDGPDPLDAALAALESARVEVRRARERLGAAGLDDDG